jgi:glucose/arabinose dehydrogenase/mono/diheme cytochrome c family protein
VAKLLAPLALIAGGTVTWACMLGADSAPNAKTAPNSGAQPRAEQGQRAVNVTRLYNDTCAKCHGENAEGGGGGTPSLLKADKFEQKLDKPFYDAIKNGVASAGMDAYGETLSDKECWALVVHIRELQGRGLRQMNGSPKATDGVYKSKYHNYRVETVIDQGNGLQTPWGIDWLPDGHMMITNRPGSITVAKDGKVIGTIDGLPKSVELGQGGMMEVAVHPQYAKNGWVYLSFTDPAKDGNRSGMTKIVRGKLKFSGDKATWGSEETIWEAPQKFYNGSGAHFGSRIVFDGKGNIFFAVGERGGNMLAQELTNPYGKIYRVKEDGKIPSDNPFVGVTDSIPGIWSLGHRNQQGLTMDAKGNLWDTEHGPRGGDEVNRIQKGANYGWPVVAFSINYNDSPFQTPWPTAEQKITLPVFRWLPSIGASGLDYARGKAFPQWNGDLIAGGLAGQNLDRIRVNGDNLVEREELIHGMGRIREVAVGPEGFVYGALNQPDKVIRLVPAK